MTTLVAPDSIGPEHIRRAAIRGYHLQLDVSGGSAIAQLVTTTTGVNLVLASFQFRLPTPQIVFQHLINVQVKHSVAGGRFDIYGGIYENPDFTGAAVGTILQQDIACPLADEWVAFNAVGLAYPYRSDIPGGDARTLAVIIQNKTPGTLTIARNPYAGDYQGYTQIGF